MRADRLHRGPVGRRRGTGRNTLQSKVSQLRRALGDPDLVAASGGGYTARRRPGQVDALARGRPGRRGVRRRGARVTPPRRVATASEGLALFRGEVLVDAGDWLQPHRAALEEVRLGLVEDRLAARVDSRRRRRRGRRAGDAWSSAPAARGAVGLADHRAVPRRPAGRRARGVRPGAAAAGRRARRRPGPGAARPRGADAAAEPRARRTPAGAGSRPGQPARALTAAGRPRGRLGRPVRPRRRAPAGDRGRAGRRRQDPARARAGHAA